MSTNQRWIISTPFSSQNFTISFFDFNPSIRSVLLELFVETVLVLGEEKKRRDRSRLATVRQGSVGSFPDDLDQHALLAAAVELAVEDLLPRAEVELAAGDRHDRLAPHDLALVVRVGVVLARPVVMVALRAGIERRQLLEPALVVLVEAGLVVVDEHTGRDVHRVHQAEPFLDAAPANGLFHLGGDVHELHPRRDFERQRLAEMLHGFSIGNPASVREILAVAPRRGTRADSLHVSGDLFIPPRGSRRPLPAHRRLAGLHATGPPLLLAGGRGGDRPPRGRRLHRAGHPRGEAGRDRGAARGGQAAGPPSDPQPGRRPARDRFREAGGGPDPCHRLPFPSFWLWPFAGRAGRNWLRPW